MEALAQRREIVARFTRGDLSETEANAALRKLGRRWPALGTPVRAVRPPGRGRRNWTSYTADKRTWPVDEGVAAVTVRHSDGSEGPAQFWAPDMTEGEPEWYIAPNDEAEPPVMGGVVVHDITAWK